MRTKLTQLEELKESLSSMDLELLMWQHQHSVNLEKLETAREGISLLNQREESIKSLHMQAETLRENNIFNLRKIQGIAKSEFVLSSLELEEKVSFLEKELENKESLFDSQKQLIKVQQAIYNEQAKSIESKYVSVKKINLGMQVLLQITI